MLTSSRHPFTAQARGPAGLVAAALLASACGSDDVPRLDAAPPAPARVETVGTDVCGPLNRTVTASFMHEGVIYLGCTGGPLGSAWFQYDAATGQSVTTDDVIGSAFCQVTKRDVTLTYTECADSSPTPAIYQRAITQNGLGPAVPVVAQAPASPTGFTETDRTFYMSGFDPRSGRFALWTLRTDTFPRSLELAFTFDQGTFPQAVLGGAEGLFTSESVGGSSVLRYRPEGALDQPVDLAREIGGTLGWFERYRGEPTWFANYRGDLRRVTLLPDYLQASLSSGCPLSSVGVRGGDLVAFQTGGFDGGPDCDDRIIVFDVQTNRRHVVDDVSRLRLDNLFLVGVDDDYVYGLHSTDIYNVDLVRIRTEPL